MRRWREVDFLDRLLVVYTVATVIVLILLVVGLACNGDGR